MASGKRASDKEVARRVARRIVDKVFGRRGRARDLWDTGLPPVARKDVTDFLQTVVEEELGRRGAK